MSESQNKSEVWLPGSFTKNFSWGRENGLLELHNVIRFGFKGAVENVARSKFRRRISASGKIDYIPLNFFLFNRRIDGVDTVVADELVFQAINFPPSDDFDCLALFAFNFSRVGAWKGADRPQRYPARWAAAYIQERLGKTFNWNAARINADDIERFVSKDPRYKAKTARKLATNLNYLYRLGQIRKYQELGIQRWWVNALFLALDRLIEDRRIDGLGTKENDYFDLLEASDFVNLTGPRSIDKDLAIRHLTRLYSACGGIERFSEEFVLNLMQVRLVDVERYLSNDPRPGAAIHPTNPRILKTIPSFCATLARQTGFDYVSAFRLENFDLEEYIRNKAREAIEELKRLNIRPTMTADELLRLTRGS